MKLGAAAHGAAEVDPGEDAGPAGEAAGRIGRDEAIVGDAVEALAPALRVQPEKVVAMQRGVGAG